MKRFGIVGVLLIILLSAYGEKVPKQRAQEVALQFLSIQDATAQRIIKEVKEELKEDVIAYYIINYEPEGWAIVAADDRVRPILAYSLTGIFINDESLISPETRYWVRTYKEQIHSVIKDNTLPKNREWDSLFEEDRIQTKSAAASVSPLLKVTWNQNTGWNRFCPVDNDGPGGRAYVGCVGVAMAQAMSRVKYPNAAKGIHSYVHSKYGKITINYDNEAPYNWDGMSLNVSDAENSRLLYHCAVAVSMDFGAEGSGSYSNRVAGALKEHFGYTDDVKYYKRFDSDVEWIKLLKTELDKGNVLIYSGDPGTGDPGHSFNIDGYDINDYFHFNWGWSGKYDGYYSIENINPGTDKFNMNQDVVVGISETYFGPTDIILSNVEVLEDLPAGSFVSTVKVKDNSTTDVFTYALDGGPKFPRGTHEASFYIEKDTLKSKYVFDASLKNEYILNIKVTDLEMNTFSKSFIIKIQPKSISTSVDFQSESKFPKVFYSSSNKEITVSTGNSNYLNTTVELYDIRGVKYYSGLIDSDRYTISTGSLSEGIYIIRLFDSKGSIRPSTQKLLIGK